MKIELLKKISIEITLEDFRDDETVASDSRKLRYKALVNSPGLQTNIFSQSLDDNEVGTRRSFGYMLDGIREQLLRRLCPNEPPPIPPTK